MFRFCKPLSSILACLLLVCSSLSLHAQDTTSQKAVQKQKIELIHANDLRFDKSLGINAQRLLGDVEFKHEGAIMDCDSAYFFEASNSLKAFGHVRINQGDTVFMTGDTLYYLGDERFARIRGNITLQDTSMILHTHHLDYNMEKDIAYYTGGGIIDGLHNDNHLTSDIGFYYSQDNFLFFKDNVVLNNPEYSIYTDTLKYNTVSEIAYFLGPTCIISSENTIFCENGWYDTHNDIAQFNRNASITHLSYVLKGDSLYYDRKAGFGEAFRHVEILDTTNHYLLLGQYGRYKEKTGYSFVTDSAQMIQYGDQDSLFLHADTLMAVKDSIKGNRMLAWHHVKFFRKDIQGSCDSLAYSESDSLLTMFRTPLLWSQENQLSGDSINMRIYNGTIQKINIRGQAFIISRADTGKFNQIKGRVMHGYFKNNNLERLDVIGNGQSIYYAYDDKPEGRKILGVNKAECSNISIGIKNNKISRIAFLTQPTATFFSLDQFPKEQRKLKGFAWYGNRRPLTHNDIFKIDSDQ